MHKSLLCRATRASRSLGAALCLSIAGLALGAQARPPARDSMVSVPVYRARLLGVFDVDTGQPIEGAEVSDALTHASSLTSKTGTVALLFLPDSGSLVRVQKIGYQPMTMAVSITPADTVPITVLLSRVAQKLDAVVTKDSTRRYFSPGLQSFEDRRLHNAGGTFITEAMLRKSDNRKMQDVMISAGAYVQCTRKGAPPCYVVTARQSGKTAMTIGSCASDVYLDGIRLDESQRDLDRMPVNEYAAIEIYKGPATTPAEYNMTGSSCGVVLMWTRER